MATATSYGTQSNIDDLKTKAKHGIDDAADRASDIASRVQDAAGDAQRQVSQVAGNVKGAVDKSLKDQPMTTLMMAAAVGFVVGALWKS